MTKSQQRAAVVLLIAAAFFVFWYFHFERFLSFAYIKDQEDEMLLYLGENPVRGTLWYIFAYVLSTAISFPGASILTLLGGALFGVFWGTIIVSVSSTVGATLAFLASRFLFRDFVHRWLGSRFDKIDREARKNGVWYLFSLRLAPVVPFFVINLAFGLTDFSIVRFFLVSQIGMLLGTVAFVHAGTELATVRSLEEAISGRLLGVFVILSALPFLCRWALTRRPERDKR